jgi:hypothetical protein
MIFLLVCLGVLYVVGGAFAGVFLFMALASLPQMYPWTAKLPGWLVTALFFVAVVVWPLPLLGVGVQALVNWVQKLIAPDPPPVPDPKPPVV